MRKAILRLALAAAAVMALSVPASADIQECHHAKATVNGKTVFDVGECNTIQTP